MKEIQNEKEHPDYYLDEDGNCDHHWNFKGYYKDHAYYKCSRCGKEGEV